MFEVDSIPFSKISFIELINTTFYLCNRNFLSELFRNIWSDKLDVVWLDIENGATRAFCVNTDNKRSFDSFLA